MASEKNIRLVKILALGLNEGEKSVPLMDSERKMSFYTNARVIKNIYINNVFFYISEKIYVQIVQLSSYC